jgi:hypothetical protein
MRFTDFNESKMSVNDNNELEGLIKDVYGSSNKPDLFGGADSL